MAEFHVRIPDSCTKLQSQLTPVLSLFSVVLCGLAIGLLNFGDKVGRICSFLFTFVALSGMIYALMTYHWRAQAIRRRGQGHFDDRLGPTFLCIALVLAVVVNFFLRFFQV